MLGIDNLYGLLEIFIISVKVNLIGEEIIDYLSIVFNIYSLIDLVNGKIFEI